MKAKQLKPAKTLRQLAAQLEREDEWLTTAQILGLLHALGRRWRTMEPSPCAFDEFCMIRAAGERTPAQATGRGKGGR